MGSIGRSPGPWRRYALAYLAWIVACGLGLLAVLPFNAWSHHEERAHPDVFLSGLGPALVGFAVGCLVVFLAGIALTVLFGLGRTVIATELALGLLAALACWYDLSSIPLVLVAGAPALGVFLARRNPDVEGSNA